MSWFWDLTRGRWFMIVIVVEGFFCAWKCLLLLVSCPSGWLESAQTLVSCCWRVSVNFHYVEIWDGLRYLCVPVLDNCTSKKYTRSCPRVWKPAQTVIFYLLVRSGSLYKAELPPSNSAQLVRRPFHSTWSLSCLWRCSDVWVNTFFPPLQSCTSHFNCTLKRDSVQCI